MSLKISKNWSVELNENLLDVYFKQLTKTQTSLQNQIFFLTDKMYFESSTLKTTAIKAT